MFKSYEKEYNEMGMGSYILEFKFNEKKWVIDATEEKGSFWKINKSFKIEAKCQASG